MAAWALTMCGQAFASYLDAVTLHWPTKGHLVQGAQGVSMATVQGWNSSRGLAAILG